LGWSNRFLSTIISRDADALTTNTGQPVTLNGAAFQEGVPNLTWEVDWTVEEGSGNVNFENSNSRTTTATFSNSGTYLLRFTAYDKEKINLSGEEAKLITMSDYVRVTVN